MKIKFLAIIASLFILPLAITSCLDSDNEYELGTDDTISAFALDTIYGVTYKFTIDQVRKEIYNQDSVPFGSDTIINSILVKTLSYSGWVVTGDSLFIQSDSVDFSKTSKENPLEFKVYAPTGETSNTYKIWVNRHQIDPDSLVWGTNPFEENVSGGQLSGAKETKMVSLGNDVVMFASDGTNLQIYKGSSESTWESITPMGLPGNARANSVLVFNDVLYIIANTPETDIPSVFYSKDGGLNWGPAPGKIQEEWTPVNLSFETLITSFYGKDDAENLVEKTLAAIVKDNDKLVFATAVIDSEERLVWTKGANVPSDFPTGKLSATKSFATATGGQQAMLIGTPSTSETATIPWFSEDGSDWGAMKVAAKYALPKWKEPTILYYGNTLYAFGGAYDSNSENDFSTVYTSINGLAWTEITRGFLFPNDDGVSKFKDKKGYSITVDKDNYIWMGWNTADEIWRGRLNRLTFIKQ